jgi:hypothetical protein
MRLRLHSHAISGRFCWENEGEISGRFSGREAEAEPAAGADVGAGPEPSDRQFGVWFMVPVAGAERDVKTNCWFVHHLPASTCMRP